MTTVQVTTETDLTSGRKTFILPANPVPVITPMGPAPGELRVSADASGRVTDVRAVLKPKGADVAAIADLLARLATFPINPDDLRGMAGARPVVTFALQADAVDELRASVRVPQDVQALLDSPVLQAGERYELDDLAVMG